ncbi:reverse transcriptase domain-containing protein [Tanacetum coccineum]
MSITSLSFSFLQTTFETDDDGTKFNDSRSELSLKTFSITSEVGGSGDAGIKQGFLSQKRSGVGRGVKEKQSLMADKSVKVSKHANEALAHGNHSLASANEDNMNEVGTINNVANNGTTVGHTPVGNTPGMSTLYANVTSEPSRNIVNFCTLITTARTGLMWLSRWSLLEPLAKVWVKLYGVPVTAFSEDGLSTIATKLGTPLMLDSYTSDMCMQLWGRSSYARATIELQANVESKNTIMVAMPKLIGEGFYTCTIHVNQAPRGVPVGPMVGFKPIKQVYRPLSKKNNVNTSGNKKKDVESRKEVSHSNLFDVLNSVENDVNLGTNRGTSNLASKEANSSGSLF